MLVVEGASFGQQQESHAWPEEGAEGRRSVRNTIGIPKTSTSTRTSEATSKVQCLKLGSWKKGGGQTSECSRTKASTPCNPVGRHARRRSRAYSDSNYYKGPGEYDYY